MDIMRAHPNTRQNKFHTQVHSGAEDRILETTWQYINEIMLGLEQKVPLNYNLATRSETTNIAGEQIFD